MALRVGDATMSVPEFGELLARRPEWGGRPVLLVSDELMAGWVSQQLADVLRVAVAAGPQDQGRWYALLPRRVDSGQRPVRSLGASYPFPPEVVAGLRSDEPTQPEAVAAPVSTPDGSSPGVVLEPAPSPFGEALRLRLEAWRGAGWRPGLFGVAVHRVPGDLIYPYGRATSSGPPGTWRTRYGPSGTSGPGPNSPGPSLNRVAAILAKRRQLRPGRTLIRGHAKRASAVEERSCRICPARLERLVTLELCHHHQSRWYQRRNRHDGADFDDWLADQHPAAGYRRCLRRRCQSPPRTTNRTRPCPLTCHHRVSNRAAAASSSAEFRPRR